ncbi:MerR family transcriptional regulator [Sphingomonas sp. RB3P16]|uniref:MerR family transcriptional regulator n=1 Tax=Parasphingomonas frigoris TaxID=3096163 RepID=UPI002FCC0767
MPDSLQALDITDVARRTGLTSRALRFYEARGLVRPLRSAAGRRFYGPAELERVHQIVMLKRAGLTLAQIDRFVREGPPSLARIVTAQLAALAEHAQEIAAARALLLTVQSRIERSEPIDVATFCSLIQHGDRLMPHEHWDAVTDRYYTPEEKARFVATLRDLPIDHDPAAYAAQWAELGARIKAALPLAPDSAAAQGFVTEWQALLAPFKAVATPEMIAGVKNVYDHFDEWESETTSPGFDREVFAFINAAAQHRTAA